MSAPVGIIGGTALARLAALEDVSEQTVDTAFGTPSGPLIHGRLDGRAVVFIMRHGPRHTLAPHAINYRANIRALADAGAQQVIAIGAVGGITPAMTTGRLVVPHQLIDYSWGRAHSFAAPGAPVPHIDFTEPYDATLRARLLDAARVLGWKPADHAVHAVTQGPRLETAAEIDRLERDGCDIVGMTGMPEAALAREAGLAYACCALVVNPAAGRGVGAIHSQIEQTIQAGMTDIARLLDSVVAAL